MTLIQSALLQSVPGIHHAFGHRGEPIPALFQEKWNEVRPEWKQVHGTTITESAAPRTQCGEADALWTRLAGNWVGVVTADCVPVLIASRDGSVVAAIHAGWRGSLAGITRRTVAMLTRQGVEPSSLVAAIGPCIRSCCFEVGEDVQEEFLTAFPQIPEEELRPRHRHLDLVALNAAQLRGMGIGAVDVVGSCTKCATNSDGSPLFHSFRREGGGTRQWSLIGRDP